MIEKLPTYDDKKLAAIEENARRLSISGTEAQKVLATAMLAAISAERRRRKDDETSSRMEKRREVVDRIRDMAFMERVVVAFTEMPPAEWELEVLREIAARPDQDGTSIAKAIGKTDVGYINLAVGTIDLLRKSAAYFDHHTPRVRMRCRIQ